MSNDYKYEVSLIIPIYNMEKYLKGCLDSVVAQTIDKSLIEVLLISDGSKDSSIDIMKEYAAKYPYMKIFEKENEGLSMTRNYGIERAQGKYLMYLDSDDTLSANTLELVTDFFDDHYDEIDLVVYDEIPVINGEEGDPHYRYTVFDGAGVYDLNDFQYAYVSQTRINVCVKNEGDNNVLFDFDRTFRQEDQKYCTQVLQRKMRIGYCPGAIYYYLHQPESIVRTFFYAYYIFESSMKFWEEIFAYYGENKVPYYIQALYLNDVNWKTQADILLPYHYPPEQFEEAKGRVLKLLNKVDDVVILNHPALDRFQKHYFITSKSNNEIKISYENSYITVFNHDEPIIEKGRFKILVNRFKFKGDKLSIVGILESTVLDYIDQPELIMYRRPSAPDGEIVPLRFSSYSYHKAKAISVNKYFFDIVVDAADLERFSFSVKVNDRYYKCKCRFNNNLGFGKAPKTDDVPLKTLIRAGRKITYTKTGSIDITKLSPAEEKKALTKLRRKGMLRHPDFCLLRNQAIRYKKKRIWLYYDCKGVFKDNAYYQIEHDINIADGIDRYYILNEETFSEEAKKYPEAIRNKMVQFGSRKHKALFLAAEKIVTAYIERSNYNPFTTAEEYKRLLDLFDLPDIYYLQHGVLHAHAPWKYSADRNFVKKEIISTRFEEQNLNTNYCFSDERLAKTGMPRYDFIDSDQKKGNRVLFAPSWRKYLIAQQGPEWIPTESKFLGSLFYKETQAFLESDELRKLLEEHDSYLDFKLHPIFECYKHLYSISNPRVCISSKKISETDYSVFVTDFSSFAFDFAYLNTPIIYFMPDLELFKAGMNYYRQLDMPLEDGLGPLTTTGDEALDVLGKLLAGDPQGEFAKYQEKMENLFFYKDNKQRERIYREIISD